MNSDGAPPRLCEFEVQQLNSVAGPGEKVVLSFDARFRTSSDFTKKVRALRENFDLRQLQTTHVDLVTFTVEEVIVYENTHERATRETIFKYKLAGFDDLIPHGNFVPAETHLMPRVTGCLRYHDGKLAFFPFTGMWAGNYGQPTGEILDVEFPKSRLSFMGIVNQRHQLIDQIKNLETDLDGGGDTSLIETSKELVKSLTVIQDLALVGISYDLCSFPSLISTFNAKIEDGKILFHSFERKFQAGIFAEQQVNENKAADQKINRFLSMKAGETPERHAKVAKYVETALATVDIANLDVVGAKAILNSIKERISESFAEHQALSLPEYWPHTDDTFTEELT